MREGAGEDPMARSVNDRSLPTAQSIATTSMATASQYGTLPGLEMKIPAWLQRDRESQRNLFCESSSFCSTDCPLSLADLEERADLPESDFLRERADLPESDFGAMIPKGPKEHITLI